MSQTPEQKTSLSILSEGSPFLEVAYQLIGAYQKLRGEEAPTLYAADMAYALHTVFGGLNPAAFRACVEALKIVEKYVPREGSDYCKLATALALAETKA